MKKSKHIFLALAAWSLTVISDSNQRLTITPITNALGSSTLAANLKYKIINDKNKASIEVVSDDWFGGGMEIKSAQGRWPEQVSVFLRTSQGDAYQILENFNISTAVLQISGRYQRHTNFPLQRFDKATKQWTPVSSIPVTMLSTPQAMRVDVPAAILVSKPETIRVTWIYKQSLH